MFGRQVKSEIDSLVGISARIEGDLCFTGGLRIDGEVHGNVVAAEGADSMLIVSEHARIEGGGALRQPGGQRLHRRIGIFVRTP